MFVFFAVLSSPCLHLLDTSAVAEPFSKEIEWNYYWVRVTGSLRVGHVMKITDFSLFNVNNVLAFVPLQGFVPSQIFANFANWSF
jgi:hypothetical protein